jgi:hypothetical protein
LSLFACVERLVSDPAFSEKPYSALLHLAQSMLERTPAPASPPRRAFTQAPKPPQAGGSAIE